MATLSRLKPGQIVYSVRKDWRGKMGTFPVRIVAVYPDCVSASINNNPVRTYLERIVKTWRVKRREAGR